MASAASRTPYNASTPDRTHFGSDIPLARLDDALANTAWKASEQPNETTSNATISFRSKLSSRWKSFRSQCVDTCRNNTGLLLVAASQLFGSMMSVLVKKLNSVDPPVPPLELICVRMTITWACCVTYMVITKVPDPVLGPKGIRLLLAFRGIFGFAGLFGSYYSLQYLSLSDATVLQFLAPMSTAVAGALVLKEDFKRSQAVASLCSLVGVILIARPTFLFGHFGRASSGGKADPEPDVILDGRSMLITRELTVTPAQRLGAVGIALLGVMGSTGAYTTIRAIGKRAHPMHNVVAFSTQCVFMSSLAMLILRTHIVLPTRLDWIAMLLGIGFCGFWGQILMTMGLQREAAGRVTMAVYVQIIFATINDLIFFHSTPSLLSIIGTAIIMTSAIYVAVTKENTGKHKRSRSMAVPMEDSTLEEGLLANQEEGFEVQTNGETVELDDGLEGEAQHDGIKPS
ncbi:DUF6-domain-containing protein [Wolfiporia cocos MD-104 SS10]|uniref:DUF6-domain-containing protein n=1 Tax=Wolfiporia cocos (strain MD-104) TaxID=742152 RepID=A0A2H3J7D2_WOLCO|nr:DUF6-domain-containing protein [Wolfiporia cocos MD-104 SS10]